MMRMFFTIGFLCLGYAMGGAFMKGELRPWWMVAAAVAFAVAFDISSEAEFQLRKSRRSQLGGTP